MSVYVQLMLTTLAKSSLESQGQPNRNLEEVFHLSVLVKMPRRTWEKLHHSLWVWLERPDRLLMFLFLLLVYTSCTKRQFFCCENVIYACDELWSDSFPSLNISLFYLPLAPLSPPGVLIHAPPHSTHRRENAKYLWAHFCPNFALFLCETPTKSTIGKERVMWLTLTPGYRPSLKGT